MKLTRTLVGVALLFFGIGLGVMAHTIVNAQEPDEEPEAEPQPLVAVLLLCSPDCKVVEETPQDELIAGLEDENETLKGFIRKTEDCKRLGDHFSACYAHWRDKMDILDLVPPDPE